MSDGDTLKLAVDAKTCEFTRCANREEAETLQRVRTVKMVKTINRRFYSQRFSTAACAGRSAASLEFFMRNHRAQPAAESREVDGTRPSHDV